MEPLCVSCLGGFHPHSPNHIMGTWYPAFMSLILDALLPSLNSPWSQNSSCSTLFYSQKLPWLCMSLHTRVHFLNCQVLFQWFHLFQQHESPLITFRLPLVCLSGGLLTQGYYISKISCTVYPNLHIMRNFSQVVCPKGELTHIQEFQMSWLQPHLQFNATLAMHLHCAVERTVLGPMVYRAQLSSPQTGRGTPFLSLAI